MWLWTNSPVGENKYRVFLWLSFNVTQFWMCNAFMLRYNETNEFMSIQSNRTMSNIINLVSNVCQQQTQSFEAILTNILSIFKCIYERCVHNNKLSPLSWHSREKILFASDKKNVTWNERIQKGKISESRTYSFMWMFSSAGFFLPLFCIVVPFCSLLLDLYL